MTRLSRKVSQTVIREMIFVLGERPVLRIIESKLSQLRVIVSGKGFLSQAMLSRIQSETDKSWRGWLLDAVARNSAVSAVVSPTAELVRDLDLAESDGQKSSGHVERLTPSHA